MSAQVMTKAARELGVDAKSLHAEPISNQFFHRWKFWHVRTTDMPPAVITLASNGDTVTQLSLQDGFRKQVTIEPVRLSDEEGAIAYAKFFLSVAGPDFDVLGSVGDIPGVRPVDAERWRDKIVAPRCRKENAGYAISLWLWSDKKLYEDRLTISEGGIIDNQLKPVATGIGVAISIE
jgi:hypothetical protein